MLKIEETRRVVGTKQDLIEHLERKVQDHHLDEKHFGGAARGKAQGSLETLTYVIDLLKDWECGPPDRSFSSEIVSSIYQMLSVFRSDINGLVVRVEQGGCCHYAKVHGVLSKPQQDGTLILIATSTEEPK